MQRLLFTLLVLFVLAGCATNLPESVRQAPSDNPSLEAVRANPEAFEGRQVRWGGTITGVENRRDETCIEVVQRPLQTSGRPLETDHSEGRFLACVSGFLDPAVYAESRLFTVGGYIEGTETRPVGNYPYRYPVIRVTGHQLWERQPEPAAYDHPGYFWDPWYGPNPYHYPHPYYGSPYHR